MPRLTSSPELREFHGVYKDCWAELPLYKKGAAVMYGVGREAVHLPLQITELGIDVIKGIVNTFTDAISNFFASIGETWSESMFQATLKLSPGLEAALTKCIATCSVQVVAQHLGFSEEYTAILTGLSEKALYESKDAGEYREKLMESLCGGLDGQTAVIKEKALKIARSMAIPSSPEEETQSPSAATA